MVYNLPKTGDIPFSILFIVHTLFGSRRSTSVLTSVFEYRASLDGNNKDLLLFLLSQVGLLAFSEINAKYSSQISGAHSSTGRMLGPTYIWIIIRIRICFVWRVWMPYL